MFASIGQLFARFFKVLHRFDNVSQKSTKNPNFVFTFEGWKMYTKLGFLVTNFSNDAKTCENVEEPCGTLGVESGKCLRRLDNFSHGFSRFYIDLTMLRKLAKTRHCETPKSSQGLTHDSRAQICYQ